MGRSAGRSSSVGTDRPVRVTTGVRGEVVGTGDNRKSELGTTHLYSRDDLRTSRTSVYKTQVGHRVSPSRFPRSIHPVLRPKPGIIR